MKLLKNKWVSRLVIFGAVYMMPTVAYAANSLDSQTRSLLSTPLKFIFWAFAIITLVGGLISAFQMKDDHPKKAIMALAAAIIGPILIMTVIPDMIGAFFAWITNAGENVGSKILN